MGAATKGALGIAAFAHNASAWSNVDGNAAVAFAANKAIEFRSDNVQTDVQLVDNLSMSGGITMIPGDQGNEFEKGDLSFDAKYETLEPLFAHCIGQDTAAQVGADPVYSHTMKILNDIFGIYGTIAVNYQTEVHEYPCVKVHGWKLECKKADQVAKFTIHTTSSALVRNGASGTNNTTNVSSATLPAGRNRLLFNQMICNLRAQDNIAFAGTDSQLIEGFTLEVARTVKQDDVTTALGKYVDEPQDNGFLKVTLNLQYSRYDSVNGTIARVNDMLSKNQAKCLITFTGAKPTGSAAATYLASFYLNGLQVRKGRPNITGPGLTPFSIDLEAHAVAAAPTTPAGWPDANSIGVVLQSTRSTSALT